MSRKSHHRASREAEPNVLTTAPSVQPIMEKTMPEQQDQMETSPEPSQEQSGPTAKEMAAAEEQNQARALKIAEQAAQPPPEPVVPLVDVAARGYDALHEAFRKHNENAAKRKEYVPPPRTERQMSALEEELEAGRKAQQRAEAQQKASQPPKTDLNKEGFTTPVYRPGDVVPDPTIPATGNFVAGTRTYGPDAP